MMIKKFLPTLMLAFSTPMLAAGALGNGDDDVIEVTPSVDINVPDFFAKSSGNLFGQAAGTVPEGWILSFPNADESKYDELAAGVKTSVSPYSMPQMEKGKGVFRSSPKTLTRLETTIALADLGVSEQVLDAFVEKGVNDLTLEFACDAETFNTTLGQSENASLKFRAQLLRADKSLIVSGDANTYFSAAKTNAHLYAALPIYIKEAFRPAYVKLIIDMKPCDGMEDIADEGVCVGNVYAYISTGNVMDKDISVDCGYAGTLYGEGKYLSLEEGQEGSTAHILFDSEQKFTAARLKDINGNVVVSCTNRGDNRAVLPVNVTEALKTDYELTGQPTNPDYDPDDEDYPGNPDDGTITLTLELDGVTPSGISGVKADDSDSAAKKCIHNIAGQKITAPQRGQIYIVNGKKGVAK